MEKKEWNNISAEGEKAWQGRKTKKRSRRRMMERRRRRGNSRERRGKGRKEG